MANLFKGFLVSLCLLLLLACGASREQIAKQQSLVVDLTTECQKRIEDACKRLPGETDKLEKMLGK